MLDYMRCLDQQSPAYRFRMPKFCKSIITEIYTQLVMYKKGFYKDFHHSNNFLDCYFFIFILMVEDKECLTLNGSKLVQKEEQKQKYDSRLQIVFDTARAGMYTLIPVRDEQGKIIDFGFGLVNQAVASYLGLKAEDLVGTLGSVHFPAYKTNGLFDRYVETIKTGNPAIFDLHYADGYDNFFTINVVKMGDELFGTFTDHSP
jgi:hypothetical protein